MPNEAWLQLEVLSDEPAAVEAVFEALQALAVTITDAADQPLLEPAPGETPLWDQSRITGLFPGDADADTLRAALGAQLGIGVEQIRSERLADRAWEREWLRDFRPMQFGRRLWICPRAQRVEAPDAVVVSMDPGLAFGTGTHATTRLCLEWLDGASLQGRTVLDFGCGSGVLAVAAARLGAARVYATDIDPQALAATAENARLNDVSARIEIAPPDALPDVRAEIVLANILAGTLIELRARIVALAAPGATVVLSGILAEQIDEVRAAWADDAELTTTISEAWARLDGRLFAPAA